MVVLASRAEVARLYGRAGFGATAADLERGCATTYEALVAALFPPTNAGERPPAPDDADRIDFSGASSASWHHGWGPVTWWTERMRTTGWPLEERMTLFWHDHFATAFTGPPNTDVIMIQNQTLRVHSLGDFRALCNAMTVDAAMLIWLNGKDSVRGAVNENYAREFLELFTLGAPPPGAGTQAYTEADVQLLAKALTGWRFGHPRTVSFDKWKHEPSATPTTVGMSLCNGVDGDDSHAKDFERVTQFALRNGVAASRYLAGQLVRSFCYVPAPAAPFDGSDPLIEKVAAALRPANPADPVSRWDVARAVRTLLLAEEWRGAQPPERQGARQPVETLVHAAKVLGVSLYRWELTTAPSGGDVTGDRTFEHHFHDATARAGQLPMAPPGVGGWPAGAEWFSTMNNMARYEQLHLLFSDWLSQNVTSRVVLPPSWDLSRWTAFMGLAALSPNTVSQIQSYLAAAVTADEVTKQRGVFLLIGTSPDWQVM